MTRVLLGVLVVSILALTGVASYQVCVGPESASACDESCCPAVCPAVAPAAAPDCCDDVTPAKTNDE